MDPPHLLRHLLWPSDAQPKQRGRRDRDSAMGFLLGTLKISDFPSMMISSAKVNGVILPIVAFSLPLSQAMAIIGVPQGFVYAMTTVSENPAIIILLMIGILIIAGCVMETTPNIVILAPLMFPLAQEIGMNDVQFCIMMITTLGVGFITPPLGAESVRGVGADGRIDLENRLPRHSLHGSDADRRSDDRLHSRDFDNLPAAAHALRRLPNPRQRKDRWQRPI